MPSNFDLVTCPECRGTGAAPGDEPDGTCSWCAGSGRVIRRKANDYIRFIETYGRREEKRNAREKS